MINPTARQFDLFQEIDPPRELPEQVRVESLALLVQLMQAMIPTIAAEVSDEQDHH